VRLNKVRALLRLAPVLSIEQKQTWQIPEGLLPVGPSPVPESAPRAGPRCRCCRQPMSWISRWGPGETPPLPQWPRPP
jgi:hypothetical protein